MNYWMITQKSSQYIFQAALVAVLITPTHAWGKGLSEAEKILANCESVYTYGAHVAQMQNNNGLAVNLLFRTARTTTSLFMISEVNGKVSGKKIKQFKQIHAKIKSKLDNQRTTILQEISACDINALPITNQVENKQKILWGRSFQEIQEQFLGKLKLTIGL